MASTGAQGPWTSAFGAGYSAAGGAGAQQCVSRRAAGKLAMALAGGVGLLVSAACGVGSGTTRTEPAQTSKPLDRGVKEDLVWLIWSSNTGARGDAYNAMTKSFQERFPNVTATQVPPPPGPFGATFEKLVTTIAGGNRLDLVGVVPEYVPVYMDRAKALTDLNERLRRDATYKTSDHTKGAVDGLTWKNRLAALPVGLSTSVAVYNQELLQKKGITPPKADWDMDQVVDLSKRLTEAKGPEDTVWGFHDRMPNPLRLYTYVWAFGGEPMTPREEPTEFKWSRDARTLEAMEWVVDLHRKHGVRAGGHTPDGDSGSGLFPKNRVALAGYQINILDGVPRELRYDVIPMPRGRNGRHLYFWGFCYGLAPQSPNPDVAWEFLKHVTGEPGQREWMAKARFAPSLKSLLNGPYQRLDGAPASKQVVADAALSSERFPMHSRWPDMLPLIEQVVRDADAGKASVRDLLGGLDRDLAAAAKS